MRRRSFVLTLPLLLVSCSSQFDIRVVGRASDGLAFILTKTAGMFPGGEVELNGFRVVPRSVDRAAFERPLWAFDVPEPGSYQPVRELRYGVTPPGFRQTPPPQWLKPGVTYLAVGLGAGSFGEQQFDVDG